MTPPNKAPVRSLSERSRAYLIQQGVPAGLINKCTLEGITKELKGPGNRLASSFATASWGLIGSQGVGKTGMLVALSVLEVCRAPEDDPPAIFWIDWPAWSATMRTALARKDWDSPAVTLAPLMHLLKECERPILILDDLGREKVAENKGWAVEQLELLLDYCHLQDDDDLVLHWTTNKSVEELLPIYGGPLLSRLRGKAFDAKITSKLPDRRLL